MRTVAALLLPLLLLPAAARADQGPDTVEDFTVPPAPEPGPLTDRLPEPILRVTGEPRTILLVEKDFQRLHLLRWGEDEVELVRTYPCTTGKSRGDKAIVYDDKTPEGAYFFTNHLDPDDLLELYEQPEITKVYGAGAFPLDYPNFFDRKDGRQGWGIWLHGVEYEGRVQQPRDTRGCVAVTNADFRELQDLIELGRTPIVVTRRVDWVDPATHERLDREVWDTIEAWIDAWEAQDTDRYISFYDQDFRSRGMDREGWRDYKDRFNRLYAFIDVEMDNVGVFKEAPDRAIVDFRQTYASDRYRDDGFKRLFLRRGDDGWKIWGERWRALEIERLAPRREPDAVQIAAAEPAPATAPEEQAAGTATAEPATGPAVPEPAATSPPTAGNLPAASQPAATASSGPPPGAESSAQPSPEAGVALRDLQTTYEDGRVAVSLVLDNERAEPFTGYVTLAGLDAAGREVGHHPSFAFVRGGRPIDYRRGEWVFAPHRGTIRADVPVDAEPERLVVFVHDRDGALLVRREVRL